MSMDASVAKMEANILVNTGRALPEWVKLVRGSGLEKHGQIVKWLKEAHGFTHGYANLVAHRALESSADMQDDGNLITAQYADKKAGLIPIYERVMEVVKGFGSGLEVSPKKAYVSLRHKKQFALVQPSTATRLDLGINLKGEPPAGRLEASGSFNAMVSHRVRLESVKDVDQEVISWLKKAFDAAG